MTSDNTGLAPAGHADLSLATPPAGPPADSISALPQPPRWWTLIPPCLLTLPAAAWCVLLAAITSMLRCFDTCVPSNGALNAIAVAEFIVAVTTVVSLVTGLAYPRRRRAARLVSWIGCALACLGDALVYTWAR